ncbi:MAG: hypothetical protein V4654_05555 [Bdellovibrionota bacterium]
MENVTQLENKNDQKKILKKVFKNLNEFVIVPTGLLAMLLFLK